MMIVTDSLVPITNYIWITISGLWKKKHSLAEIKMQTWIWQAVSYIDQCKWQFFSSLVLGFSM